MKKSKLPIARYAALSDLESLRVEKAKLKTRLRKQEANLKEDVDEFMVMFRVLGNLTSVVKQAVAYIPVYDSAKMVYNIFSSFRKSRKNSAE